MLHVIRCVFANPAYYSEWAQRVTESDGLIKKM